MSWEMYTLSCPMKLYNTVERDKIQTHGEGASWKRSVPMIAKETPDPAIHECIQYPCTGMSFEGLSEAFTPLPSHREILFQVRLKKELGILAADPKKKKKVCYGQLCIDR